MGTLRRVYVFLSFVVSLFQMWSEWTSGGEALNDFQPHEMDAVSSIRSEAFEIHTTDTKQNTASP